MNRYPVWKYAIILIALLVGGLYALPNLFGEAPAVQVSVGQGRLARWMRRAGAGGRCPQRRGLIADAVALDGSFHQGPF